MCGSRASSPHPLPAPAAAGYRRSTLTPDEVAKARPRAPTARTPASRASCAAKKSATKYTEKYTVSVGGATRAASWLPRAPVAQVAVETHVGALIGDHDHVCRVVSHFQDRRFTYLVQPFAGQGDLLDVAARSANGRLNEPFAAQARAPPHDRRAAARDSVSWLPPQR